MLLASGANVHASTNKASTINEFMRKEGRSTALHFAAMDGDVSSVGLLLDHGATVNKPGPDDTTPLHFAAAGGHIEVVLLLLSRGADVHAATKGYVGPIKFDGGRTPLHSALCGKKSGSAECVEALLANGANIDAKTKFMVLERPPG